MRRALGLSRVSGGACIFPTTRASVLKEAAAPDGRRECLADDSDQYAETLHRAIAALRLQLMLLAADDPRRDFLYHDLLWCYHEAIGLLQRRLNTYRAARGSEALSLQRIPPPRTL
jgi:hypothetical protein